MNVPISKLALVPRPAAALLALALCLGLGACGSQSGTTAAGGAGTTQSDTGSPAGGRQRMAGVLMSLGLSGEQKSQIRAIMRDARAKSQNADPDTRRANYKAAFAKINGILTPDQQKRFAEKMAEVRRQRGGPQSQS